MPEAGAIHCERQRECDPGSARPSKKAGAGGARRGDWGVSGKLLEGRWSQSRGGDRVERVTNQPDTARRRRTPHGLCRALGQGEAED